MDMLNHAQSIYHKEAAMKPLTIAIRELRGERSQESFAHHLGVTRITVSTWESGAFEPSVESLRALVRAGLDPAYLLGDGVPRQKAAGDAA